MMSHWAEINQNNVVVRVTVGDSNDPNGDEGYQWLVDRLGGTWLKTSYNTALNQHSLGGTPLRGNYAGVGYTYIPDKDIFMPPSPHNGWVIDDATASWAPPTPEPDSGMWIWSDEVANWVEFDES
jgi:hypothetical protein